MSHRRLARIVAAVAAGLLLGAGGAVAQTIELTPFGGYRFGWGVGDVGGSPVIDDDGGGSFGMIANVLIGPPIDGMKFEAMFSREQARVTIQPTFVSPPVTAITTVDHMLIGVMQELEPSPQRAFISALAGVTRYATATDTEFRFTIGLGAGGKFFATRHLGLRLDARGYMTIIELGGTGICSGGCVVAFRANPVFQADVSAGLIVAF